MRPSLRPFASRGFTLVEMLVVVVIIGIMVVGAVLALGVVGRDRSLETEMKRLDALIGYAQEQAELQTRDYGLRIAPGGYAFLAFDPRRGIWIEQTDDVLRPRTLPEGLVIDLVIEGRRVVLDRPRKDVALVPHIGVLSSGDLSSFEITLRRDGTAARQTLRSLPDSTLEMGALSEGAVGS